MSFNDDEQVDAPGPENNGVGKVKLDIKKNDTASVEETKHTLMVELTGADYTGDRSGLDLVAVLDVSGSMDIDDKIGKLKTAMQFVIKKLSPMDRLSIVTFSDKGERLCPLRRITEASQPELLKKIDGLTAAGATDISDGLRIGLKVLADRKYSGCRVVGVMLMSDGKETRAGEAAQVVIGDVPVYTFGFGKDQDPITLTAVAKNSPGGTFNAIDDSDSLSVVFSQSLAGMVTIVVTDLELTVAGVKGESMIQKVSAGSYPTKPGTIAGVVIVSFGYLSSKEVRKVIVDLVLPATEEEGDADILVATYSYKICKSPYGSPSRTKSVNRTRTAAQKDDKPPPEVETEEARLKTVTMIKAARSLADSNNLDDARRKLAEARNALGNVVEKSTPLVEMLIYELQELQKRMRTQDVYEKEGRPYALASETSHDLQRFAARGDITEMRLFATPRMDKYLDQAKKFDEDPTARVPSVDDDVKEEVKENPLSPLTGPITFYIQAAVQALLAIEKLINNGLKQ